VPSAGDERPGSGGGEIPRPDEIRARLESLERRIRAALSRAGRSRDEVRLVAVSKTFPPAAVLAGIKAGLADFGENRIQEARAKIPEVEAATEPGGPPVWHFVGHLQRNKARYAARLFQWVHSVDDAALAADLGERAVREGRRLDVLVQVNASREGAKSGVPPEEAEALVERARAVEGLRVRGLMTIGPLTEDPARIRAAFQEVRELAVRLKAGRPEFDQLSMGMSGDFEIALEEGATMIRIGTAVFGARG
jgi:pyridoxal phosphate enzyme (YggS family)